VEVIKHGGEPNLWWTHTIIEFTCCLIEIRYEFDTLILRWNIKPNLHRRYVDLTIDVGLWVDLNSFIDIKCIRCHAIKVPCHPQIKKMCEVTIPQHFQV
jgi:hypothetical protein